MPVKPPLYWKTLERYKIIVGRVDREIARLQAEALSCAVRPAAR